MNPNMPATGIYFLKWREKLHMNGIKDFMEGGADLRRYPRLTAIAGGAALIVMGAKAVNPYRRWSLIATGVVLAVQGITGRVPERG